MLPFKALREIKEKMFNIKMINIAIDIIQNLICNFTFLKSELTLKFDIYQYKEKLENDKQIQLLMIARIYNILQ